MSAMTRQALALVLLLLIGSLDARAGGRLPCAAARVFKGAAVNAFVLPYRDARSDTQPEGSPSWRLPVLVQQEVLMSLLKYGSVGVTELTQEGSKVCDPREVIARVTRGTDDGALQPGRGLVLIWGRIYEEGPDLFVQSYVRFLRRDATEGITVTVPGLGAPELRLEGTLPVQAVALPPRRLGKSDISELEARARTALMLHKNPEAQPNPKPFATDAHTPFTYGVTKTQGDWMYITALTGEGWVRARSETDRWSLRRFMPELAYLDAVAGYLRLRAASVVPLTTNPARLMAHVNAGFSEFEKAVGADAAPEARALALSMVGLLQWTGDGATQAGPEDRRNAASAFSGSAALIPESPMFRTLAAVSSPYLTVPARTGADALASIDAGLLGALALDGGNAVVLRNLARLYERLATDSGQTLYEVPELARRQAVVKAVLRP